MVIKQTVAKGIIEAIADLRTEAELEDFTVIVDGTKVGCHRFILGACSQFFRGLLRSGMKESNEHSTILTGVSHSTFTEILSALYTGIDVLTNENVINIWHAASYLQIGFLIKECEDFVIANLSKETYEEVYRQAKMLDSRNVLKRVYDFMIKSFKDFRKSQVLPELSLDEMLGLVRSDDLFVSSEDEVIEAVLRYISFAHTNLNSGVDAENRDSQTSEQETDTSLEGEVVDDDMWPDDNLMRLLKLTRLCLASSDGLEMLMKNKMVMECQQTRNLVVQAVCYQLQVGQRHGQWPAAAFHRRCSDHENVLMVIGPQYAHVYSVFDNLYHNIPLIKEQDSEYCITAYDNEPYVVSPKDLFVYQHRAWKRLINGPGYPAIAISCENYIYFFSKTSKDIHKFNPKVIPPALQRVAEFPVGTSMTAAVPFEKTILVFSSEHKDGKELTAVHHFDPRTEQWTRLENLESPAMNLISFNDGDFTYILQDCGKLWKITGSDTMSVEITLCKCLWEGHVPLYGSAVFRNTICIVALIGDKRHGLPLSMPGTKLMARWFPVKDPISTAALIMPKKSFRNSK